MGLINYHQNFFSATPDTNENFIVVVPGLILFKNKTEEILIKPVR